MKFEQITEEQIMERWNAGDCPLTTRQVCDLLNIRYTPDAIPALVRRCPDFPKPRTRGPAGRGHLYFKEEVMRWLRSQPEVASARFPRGLR